MIQVATYVVDDNALFVEAIKELLLDRFRDLVLSRVLIMEFFNSPFDLIRALKQQVHICIIDFSMPGMNAPELIRQIKNHSPDCRIILMTGIEDKNALVEASDMGASTFVLKGAMQCMDRLCMHMDRMIEKTIRELTTEEQIKKLTDELARLK